MSAHRKHVSSCVHILLQAISLQRAIQWHLPTSKYKIDDTAELKAALHCLDVMLLHFKCCREVTQQPDHELSNHSSGIIGICSEPFFLINLWMMANTSMQARSRKWVRMLLPHNCQGAITHSANHKTYSVLVPICPGFWTIIDDVACSFMCSAVFCCLIAVLLRHRPYCWRAFKPSWRAIRSWPTVCSCLPRCKPKRSSKPSHLQAMCV